MALSAELRVLASESSASLSDFCSEETVDFASWWADSISECLDCRDARSLLTVSCVDVRES